MNTLDAQLLRDAEAELQIPAPFIEKDWYAVQIIRLLSQWETEDKVRPVFTGGTALSKAYKLISRFSEDVDFRLETLPPLNRKARSLVRDQLVAVLEADGWVIQDVHSRNESQYVGLSIGYPISQPQPRLRPFIKVEILHKNPCLPIQDLAVSSFIAALEDSPPEVSAIACLAIEEIASEKLSALCWRLDSEKYSNQIDLVRHLHDLACLSQHLTFPTDFSQLLLETIKEDLEGRTEIAPERAFSQLHALPGKLAVYSEAYKEYVAQTSYSTETLSFSQALSQLEALLSRITG